MKKAKFEFQIEQILRAIAGKDPVSGGLEATRLILQAHEEQLIGMRRELFEQQKILSRLVVVAKKNVKKGVRR